MTTEMTAILSSPGEESAPSDLLPGKEREVTEQSKDRCYNENRRHVRQQMKRTGQEV